MPQSLARVYLHLVFSTKHREPTLADEWRPEMFRMLGGIANNQGCPALIVGGVADHVHLLCQLSRTITIARLVNVLKSDSSAWANETKKLPGEFHWQNGYGAFSVSDTAVEAVKEYIQRQPEHHAQQSFKEEFREWLTRYGVEWDERYVWD
ncbi:MAG: IS200/IS605 family transposase [Gemmataceae bacterium]|nr:IS200/IS605 family transposase [Gemmataceae bacterium]